MAIFRFKGFCAYREAALWDVVYCGKGGQGEEDKSRRSKHHEAGVQDDGH